MKLKFSLLLTAVVALLAPAVLAQTYTFYTVAGGTQGSNDGVDLSAQFDKPSGVAVDAAGNIYVADQINSSIREITPSGTNWIVTSIAGGVQGTNDGVGTNARFSGPTGIVMDSASNIYVSDQFTYTIRKVSPAGTNWVVTTIAGQSGVAGRQDGTNLGAQFRNPLGLALDTNGNIFVADEYNNSIRELTASGTNWIVTTIAGGATNGFADGTNSAAEFYYPAGIAVDASGRIFVADLFNNSIRMITNVSGTNWAVTTIAGGTSVGNSNGVGTNAGFDAPTALALDTNGNLYVSDLFNNEIRELTPSGSNWVVTTVGGNGTQGLLDAVGTNAQFYFPFGLTFDPYGNLLIADSANNAVRIGVSSLALAEGGDLTVDLTPSNAVTAGATWAVDGGAFQTNGATVTNLSPGTHLVTFGVATNFIAPAPQSVTITAHETNTLTATYTAGVTNSGALEVLISPSDVVSAGAEWSVDAGANQTNGATLSGLTAGGHTVSFTDVNGWTTPTNQTITITNGETTIVSVTYVTNSLTNAPTNGVGSLEVTITPSGAVTAGAAWRVDGGAWETSGFTLTNLGVGLHLVSFSNIFGWTTPQDQTVTIVTNVLTNLTGIYGVAPTFSVTVNVGTGTNTGTVTGSGTFLAGSTNVVTATPASGYEFIGWIGDGTGTSSALTNVVNRNMTITAYFAPIGSEEIIVVTNGSGKVTPNYAGKTLRAGTTYTLSATPNKGYLFAGWTGSITTNRTPLRVKLTNSIVLEATFVANPFIPTMGIYNGLFLPATNITVQNAGMIKGLSLRQNGTYAGTLYLNGAAHGFSGSLNLAGEGTNVIKITTALGGPVAVTLNLMNGTNPAPQITGLVTGFTNNVQWSAEMVADLTTNIRGTSDFTLLLAPNTNASTNVPGGYGYASIVDANNTARIAGGLADGTTLSDSVAISKDGYVPVYVRLYANKGLLIGWINLQNTNAADVSLTWIHPPTRTGLYQAGFTNFFPTNQILLSPWTNRSPEIDLFTNVALLGDAFDTNGFNLPITTAANGHITGNLVSGSLNPATGVFRVTVTDGGVKVTGVGAVLLNETNGGGYFLTKTNAQAILLQ